MDVSILIVNHNHGKYIEDCLRSIFENAGAVDFEVIVVDNRSTDRSGDLIREKFPTVMLERNPEPRGLARNNNQAMRRASGRHLLLLNPDTRLYPGALERMVAYMDAHEDVAACGARLLNPDGTVQYSCRRFPTVSAVLFRGLSLAEWFPLPRFYREYLMVDWDHAETRAVDWVLGACMMIRPAALADVGMMDEGFFLYYEEIDWCYRAKQRGWKIVYLADAEVMHHYLRMSAEGIPSRLTLIHARSILRYFRKHFLSMFRGQGA